MLQSDHLGQSLDSGAGTGTSPDSESTLDQLIPVVVRVLPLTGLRPSQSHAARNSPSAGYGGVKVGVPPPTPTFPYQLLGAGRPP